MHPGSHVGVGISEGIKNISDALTEVLKDKDGVTVILCGDTPLLTEETLHRIIKKHI